MPRYKKMPLAEARARLLDAADELDRLSNNQIVPGHKLVRLAAMIRYVEAKGLHNKPPSRRAPRTSERVTTKLKDEVRAYVKANPAMPYRHVGDHFNVADGRISEIMAE